MIYDMMGETMTTLLVESNRLLYLVSSATVESKALYDRTRTAGSSRRLCYSVRVLKESLMISCLREWNNFN